MSRPASDKRERLAAAAAQLVASHGLDGATIAAIAERAGVAPGSVYYYLRTKDEVASAAAGSVAQVRRARLAQWSAAPSAAGRLAAYLDAAAAQAPTVTAAGNIASLAAQLREPAPAAADVAAAAIRETVDWAAEQFVELGHAPDAAAARALHLVTGIEGAGQLSHALADPTPLQREAAHLSRWVASSRSSA